MNYKKIYNQLDCAGLIDKILAETNFDKIGIIKGIQYLESFVGSYSFKEMKYWTIPTADKTVCKVCDEYAKLMINNNDKFLKQFEYMAKTMNI